MSKKSKVEPVEKVKIVEQYLRSEIGLNETARLSDSRGYVSMKMQGL